MVWRPSPASPAPTWRVGADRDTLAHARPDGERSPSIPSVFLEAGRCVASYRGIRFDTPIGESIGADGSEH